jgi:nucleoside-diphosphate-sugar epimerase
MNILITGATGFVGTNLIREMNPLHTIHALVRPSTDLSKVNTDRVFVFKDNIDALATYIKTNGIEGIIHLASLYIAEHKPDQIKDLVLSNVYLGTAVLEASVKANVKWFINTGTIWQNFNVPPLSMEYCPVNLYAASKQAFVDMAKYYTETSDLKFCTLKLCDTYGPGDPRKKLYALLERIAQTGETLQMSPGEQKLDMIPISQVVSGFCLLAKKMSAGEHTEKEYVLTSGKQLTLKEIAAIYEKEHNVQLHIEWGGRPYRSREVMNPYIGNPLNQ